MGHDDGHLAVGEHQREARVRIARVEGQPRAPRLEDTEDGDGHVGAPLDAHAHERVGADAFAAQEVGEAVRTRAELAVGEDLLAILHGGRIGGARHLRFEEVVERVLLGEGLADPAPLHEHEVALLGARQGQRPDGHVPLGGHRLEHHAQVLEGAGPHVVVDAAAVVLEGEHDLGPELGEQHERVARPLPEVDAPPFPQAALALEDRLKVVALGDVERLEQAGAAAQAGPLLDAREGRVLESAQGNPLVPEPTEQLAEPTVVRDRDPHGHRVDRHADQLLGTLDRAASPGAGGAEDHILPSRVAREEDRPASLHRVAERRAVLLGEGAEPVGRLHRQVRDVTARDCTLVERQGPRAVHAERCRQGRPLEQPAIVRLGATRVLGVEPQDKVAEGRVLGQLRGRAGAHRVVGEEELAQHDEVGAAIEQQVVVGPDEAKGLLTFAEQGQAHAGRLVDGDAAAPVVGEERLDARIDLFGRQAAQVELFDRHLGRRVDELPGRRQVAPLEGRSEDRVAIDEDAPRLEQGGHLERLLRSEDDLLVVGSRANARDAVEKHPRLHRRHRVAVDDLGSVLGHL